MFFLAIEFALVRHAAPDRMDRKSVSEKAAEEAIEKVFRVVKIKNL